MDTIVSGVGVIDKSVAVIEALTDQPRGLAELAEATGLNRATAHRLAVALEHHRLVRRTDDGRFTLGFRFLELAQRLDGLGPLVDIARPHLRRLSDATGESAQLYVRDGDERVCVAAAESEHGLRTIVPVGARLTLERGSAGAVLTGRVADDEVAVSIGEREEGVASVSAAVVRSPHRATNGNATNDGASVVVAALSVSGPIERIGPDPGSTFGTHVAAEAKLLSAALGSR